MISLQERFESLESWSRGCTHDAVLREQDIGRELAIHLSEIGSGEIRTADGGLYHVLDPDGIAYWSREVLEKLQGICQPDGLCTFFIEEGGGTYAFVCSNGVYTMHHRGGFLGRCEDLASFFGRALTLVEEGEEPFDEVEDGTAIEQMLRQAKMRSKSSFDERIAGKVHTDFRSYDPHTPWKKGELMMHPQEGRGIVVAVKTTMYIQVEFASGKKTLCHKGW